MKIPTIVILPGWMLGATRYTDLSHELNSLGYETLTVDFPGFSEGEKIKRPWKLDDYVLYLKNLLDQHKFSKVIFICHSFGGRVALKFSYKYQGRVAGLVICGTPGYTPIPKSRLLFFIWLAKLGAMFFSIPPLTFVKDEIRKLYYLLVGAKEFYHAQGFMQATFKNIVSENLENIMKNINVPTLLIWGEIDSIVSVSVAQRMQSSINNSNLIIVPNASHMLPVQNPKIFVKKIQSFLLKL